MRWGETAALTVAFGTLLSCGAPSREDWPEGRPRIDDLTFLQQAPQDPTGLQFELLFFDSDGDLGRGELMLFLDGALQASRGLDEIFAAQKTPIESTATAGSMEVVVRISDPIPEGGTIEVSFKLVDGDGRESNEFSMTLQVFGGGGT